MNICLTYAEQKDALSFFPEYFSMADTCEPAIPVYRIQPYLKKKKKNLAYHSNQMESSIHKNWQIQKTVYFTAAATGCSSSHSALSQNLN